MATSKTWWSSDHHYYHTNICQHTDRKTVVRQEDHDQWLIDLHNSIVSKSDVFWHLGDFAFNKRRVEQFTNITSKLNGNKKFLRGNHDDKDILKKSGFEWYDLKGSQLSDGTHIVMCHYPLAIWDKHHRGSFMLHGHSHGGYQPEFGKILDVGIDNHYRIYGYYGYFNEEKIIEYMSSREFKALDHHTEGTNQ